MGAFFLFNKNKEIDTAGVLNSFEKKGFKPPQIFELGEFHVYLYKKILTESYNHFSVDKNIICGVGTIIYKCHPPKEVLSNIFQDILEGTFDKTNLKGNYTIIYYIEGQLSIIKDEENLYNIFYTQDQQIISSSYLGILNSFKSKLTLNKIVITELLVTGYVIGEDTIFKEIFRVEKNKVNNSNKINWMWNSHNLNLNKDLNYSETVDEQLNELKDYFKTIKRTFELEKCSVGVTGGFDSRLLIGFIKKTFVNPIYFSHYRKAINSEISIAKKITDKLKVDLFSPKVNSPIDMSNEELNKQLEDAMFFLDGQIRASTFWTEIYNTFKYFKYFEGKSALNFNGIGGEQYRNGERIIFSKKMAEWYYFETAYKYTGELFYENLQKEEFFLHLNKKIKEKFPDNENQNFSKKKIKIFLNELFNPAGRCLRISTENQLFFVLAPFTDYTISNKAYSAIEHLGLSCQFEIDMINKLVPELKSIQTSYGYNLEEGEPLKNKLLTIIKEFLPIKLYYKVLQRKKKKNKEGLLLFQKHNTFTEYFNLVKKLNLPINLDKLKHSAAHNPHIIALGFFLNYYSAKIKND